MTSLLTITSKGQITLSQAVLRAMRIGVGDKVAVRVRNSQAVLEPVGKGILSIAGSLGSFRIPKGKRLDDVLHEAREELLDENILR